MNLYYYIDEQNTQRGPFQASELTAHGVNASTMVWTYGMEQWLPADQVPELVPFLSQAPAGQPGGYTNYPNQSSPADTPYSTPHNGSYSGPAYVNDPVATPPNNYLVWSILATIFCCLPLGIVAIVRGSQVNSLFQAGDIQGAQKASHDAKNWTIATAIVGFILNIICIGIAIAMFFYGSRYDYCPDYEDYYNDSTAVIEYYEDDISSDDYYIDDNNDSYYDNAEVAPSDEPYEEEPYEEESYEDAP